MTTRSGDRVFQCFSLPCLCKWNPVSGEQEPPQPPRLFSLRRAAINFMCWSHAMSGFARLWCRKQIPTLQRKGKCKTKQNKTNKIVNPKTKQQCTKIYFIVLFTAAVDKDSFSLFFMFCSSCWSNFNSSNISFLFLLKLILTWRPHYLCLQLCN